MSKSENVKLALIDVARGSLFNLSIVLEEDGCRPVMWMGYAASKTLPMVKKRYPECEVYDYWRFNRGATFFSSCRSSPPTSVLQSFEFLKIKDRAIKMMDRQDAAGRFRRQDREALFYSLFNFFYAKVIELDVDLIISAHSPHLPAPFIMYEVCKLIGIKAVHIREVPNTPVLYLATDYCGGYLLNGSRLNEADWRVQSLRSEIVEISEKHVEPGYMKSQKKSLELPVASGARRSACPELVKGANFKKLPQSRLSYDVYSIDFLRGDEGDVRYLDQKFNEFEHAKFKREVAKVQYEEYVHSVHEVNLSRDYVFFPLHYEPEKTSNPDGGEFYCSYSAITALRSYVPGNVPIYIKEHITQFHQKFDGYMGRSPYLYKSIASLPNVFFVDLSINTRSLVEHSVFVASQTGTACLEAACLRKKAVLFGDVWFSSLPNVHRFSEIPSYDQFCSLVASESEAVADEVVEWICRHGIFGYITGSFIRAFQKKYPEQDVLDVGATCRGIANSLRYNNFI